jgi:diacylglycerol kinase
MRRFIKSFSFAANGMRTVLREERNFRIQIFLALAAFVGALYFRFSYTELVIILIAGTFVLAGEIVNTAIEDLCDKVEPHHDPQIGKIKDTMAAYVLLCSFSALVMVVIVYIYHFAV